MLIHLSLLLYLLLLFFLLSDPIQSDTGFDRTEHFVGKCLDITGTRQYFAEGLERQAL